MKRQEYNEIERLILQVVAEHPGCTQHEVHRHLIAKYRAWEYVRSSIARLIALKHLKNTGNNKVSSLYLNVVSAQ